MYREYRFYLAFENSNCKEYITEKFFVTALGHNILPIVMGASRFISLSLSTSYPILISLSLPLSPPPCLPPSFP